MLSNPTLMSLKEKKITYWVDFSWPALSISATISWLSDEIIPVFVRGSSVTLPTNLWLKVEKTNK